jgi:hypothetical protein
VSGYVATSKKLSHYQRCIPGITTARKKAWLSLKHFGRQVVHQLVKWCLLPLAIAACFSMIPATPADFPADYYGTEEVVQMEQQL